MAAVGALIGGEVWLRMSQEKPPGVFVFPDEPRAEAEVQVPHPTRLHAYRPGFDGVVTHSDRQVRFRTNERGFRDGPFETDDPWRVMAVGSSFTLGWGLDADQAWPAQLEERLNQGLGADAPGRVRVYNTAVTGYSLAQLRALTEELLPELRPQVVVVGVSTRAANGLADPRVRFHGRELVQSEARRLLLEEEGFFRSVFDAPPLQRVDQWLAHNLRVVSLALRSVARALDPPPGPKEHQAEYHDDWMIAELERLRAVTEEAGAALVVLPINHQRKDGGFPGYLRRRSARIMDFCSEEGLVCVDAQPAFDAEADAGPRFRQGRDIHWSAEAHGIAADLLAPALVNEGFVPAPEERAGDQGERSSRSRSRLRSMVASGPPASSAAR